MKTVVKCSNCGFVLLEENGCANFDSKDLTPCPNCEDESGLVDVDMG